MPTNRIAFITELLADIEKGRNWQIHPASTYIFQTHQDNFDIFSAMDDPEMNEVIHWVPRQHFRTIQENDYVFIWVAYHKGIFAIAKIIETNLRAENDPKAQLKHYINPIYRNEIKNYPRVKLKIVLKIKQYNSNESNFSPLLRKGAAPSPILKYQLVNKGFNNELTGEFSHKSSFKLGINDLQIIVDLLRDYYLPPEN
jgi:hypothetical protein